MKWSNTQSASFSPTMAMEKASKVSRRSAGVRSIDADRAHLGG
jgi:hypothetical protein